MNFIVKNFFAVKLKSRYSCESVIFFNLGVDIIKKHCNFLYYFNKTDIKPSVLDGGHDIILEKLANDKHIVCNFNNDIPVKIPSFSYILVKRSVLNNCDIKAESTFLLESITACHNTKSELVMYFAVNMAFVNYFDNLTDSLDVPILYNCTTYEQILPIYLQPLDFDSKLLQAPKTLKEFVHQFQHKKEILICEKGILVKMI